MPHAPASSSMADSSANMPGHSPGARIQDGVGTSSRTTRWVVRRCGAAYMCRVATADCSVNSLSVEVWPMTSWHSAVSLPSGPAPSRTRWIDGARWPVTANICGRVTAHLTGRPVTRAAMAARMTLARGIPLAPKPPPTCSAITRTCPGSSPNTAATCPAARDGPWVASYTVSVSPCHAATVACGSIGWLCSAGVR